MCRGKGADGWVVIPMGLLGGERLFRPPTP